MDLSGWEAVAVIYAAIVATAALALEVRRWVESGPRRAGSVVYNDELREWAETGGLFVVIYYSHSSRPIQAKVKLSANGDGE